MSVDPNPNRYTLLCQETFGDFYWDSVDKLVVTRGVEGQMIPAARRFVVSMMPSGYWIAKPRPKPRIIEL